jgi:hypothetical protein
MNKIFIFLHHRWVFEEWLNWLGSWDYAKGILIPLLFILLLLLISLLEGTKLAKD